MLHEYIPKAIKELEEGDGSSSHFQPEDNTLDVLIDLIAHESVINPDELKISEQKHKRIIKNIIKSLSDSSDPISEFHSRMHALKDDVKQREFTIIFPWNFWPTSVEGFEHPVEISDVRIERVSRQYWEKYKEAAVDESTFDEFLDEVPAQRFHDSPFTCQKFWMVEYEAGDSNYAVNNLANTLELLCGKITFSKYCRFNPHFTRQTSWKYGITDLKAPLCFLILEEEEFLTYFTSFDFTPRRKFKFDMKSDDRFNFYYPELPDFTGDVSTVEEHLMTALSGYQSAMSEGNPRQSFLEFWRCLEAATLSQDEDYSANEPLKRGRVAARPKQLEISDSRIERLVSKRNTLIHKGGQAEITEGDLVHLKTLAESSIWFLTKKRDEYLFDELQFLFEYGAKSDDGIFQAKREREKQISEKKEVIDAREREIELIEDLIEWYELDEGY